MREGVYTICLAFYKGIEPGASFPKEARFSMGFEGEGGLLRDNKFSTVFSRVSPLMDAFPMFSNAFFPQGLWLWVLNGLWTPPPKLAAP